MLMALRSSAARPLLLEKANVSIQFVGPGYPPVNGEFTPRERSTVTDLVIHHTAGPKTQTPLEIDAFERTRGDIYMPYTWLIGPDGTIYNGRPPLAVSAATYGRNVQSVAICLIGNFQSDDAGFTGDPPSEQLNALLSLAIWVHRQFPTIDNTYAHGQVYQYHPSEMTDYTTACCGNALIVMLPDIKNKIRAALQHG